MEIKRVIVGPLQSNVYIISSNKEGIIIDAGDEAHKILDVTQDILIKYILLTHNHPDHIAAIEPLKKKLKAKCGIHALDKIGDIVDFELKEGKEIQFGKEALKVLHTPGHTPGGCCFLVRDHLFSGDTLFLYGYGRTDLPGGDEGELFKSIARLLKLPPTTQVYPGHGPYTTIGDERKLYSIKE
jgi:glyoxylase-like metal-dependent hydrolase (beta-lactamase superfamily II)